MPVFMLSIYKLKRWLSPDWNVGGAVAVLLFILFSASSSAADLVEFKRFEVLQDVNMVRVELFFDRIPLYTLKTSGQKVELTLLDTHMQKSIDVSGENESIARILVGEGPNKLLFSFLLRRPPVFVNALKHKDEKMLSIDMFWRVEDNRRRPAISHSLPGGLYVGPVGGVSRKAIASKYSMNWEQFILDYERSVDLQVPLDYTLPAFPVMNLLFPADGIVPFEVLDAAAAERWDVARNAYMGMGFADLEGVESVVRLLVLVDLSLRQQKCKAAIDELGQAQDEMQKFDPGSEERRSLFDAYNLLRLYSHARCDAQPFALLAELNLLADAGDALVRHPRVTFLQAEAELAAGHPDIALQQLDGLRQTEVEQTSDFIRRQADAMFEHGDLLRATKIYAELDGYGALDGHPYSMLNYAESLYGSKNYPDAEGIYSRLKNALTDQDMRDMVSYQIARCMLHEGQMEGAMDALGKILPGSRAALLARMKLADFSAVNNDFRSREQALFDYTELLNKMPTRQGKAEVFIKKAIVYNLLQRPEQAIATLKQFLDVDRLSELRVYAQALLAEILPPFIEGLVEREQYFDAMLLVEQNRDLLLASQRSYSFLFNLGSVFNNLEFYARAVKLYQYVLDATTDKFKLEAVYVPLLKAEYSMGEFSSVERYAKQYLDQFKSTNGWMNPEHAASVYLYYIKALISQGKEENISALLRKNNRPHSMELDRFAAHYFWQRDDIGAVQKLLEGVATRADANAEDLFMYAEALYKNGKSSEALQYYEQLKKNNQYRLPALYRIGNILLEQGKRTQALSFLTQVVESKEESSWKDLARQSLLIQQFD